MKKVLVTILAFVYLTSSMGATIHLHYCMGKLASWSLIDHDSKNCEQCGMIKKTADAKGIAVKTDCCRDEHRQIKSNQDQKSSPAEFFKYISLYPFPVIREAAADITPVLSVAIAYPNTHAPPLFGKLPRFILFRNFRI